MRVSLRSPASAATLDPCTPVPYHWLCLPWLPSLPKPLRPLSCPPPVFSAYDLECVDLTKAARLAANYREPASVVQAMNDTDKAKATAESRASRQKKLWEKLDSLDAEDSCFSSQVGGAAVPLLPFGRLACWQRSIARPIVAPATALLALPALPFSERA